MMWILLYILGLFIAFFVGFMTSQLFALKELSGELNAAKKLHNDAHFGLKQAAALLMSARNANDQAREALKHIKEYEDALPSTF